jgi:ABC-type branched-subunit amino acid transport system substrate-binding protein/LysM repeat protein
MQKKIFLFLIVCVSLVFSGIAQDKGKEKRSTVIEKKDGKEYYIHTVKKGQSLYMISKLYGVEISEIVRENPDVKEGIKSEQKLKIPRSVVHEPIKKQPKIPVEEPVVSKPEPVPVEEALPCEQISSRKKTTYNVALMMPLYLNEVDQMDDEEISKSGIQDYHPFQFIAFYEGFRIALDSLKKSGISVQVNVYDVINDTIKIKKILKDPELKKMNLIIGLLYNRPFKVVEDFAQRNNIPLVNPLSEREQIVEGNTEVIKTRPAIKSQAPQLVQYLTETYPEDVILIVNNRQYSNKEAVENLFRECQAKKLDAHITQDYESTMNSFSKEKENVVIAFSEDKSYVLDLITKLNEWRNEYKITLMGLPRWDKLDDIEVDYLVNLKTHIVAPYFIDYDDAAVKKFIARYQDQYKTDPDPLAFQGFDAGYFFITALTRYGKSFERCLPDLRMKSLQTNFQFSSTKGNGFVNQHWEIYWYENFFLKSADHK